MAKGLAWIDAGRQSSKVIVLKDDGEKDILPAALYVAMGIEPPIYELPVQAKLEPLNAIASVAGCCGQLG